MIIYHGSNQVVEKPEIRISNRALDFGDGFYCTSDRDQASRWAKSVYRRRGGEGAILNIYECNTHNGLKKLLFDGPNAEWLDYVVANRRRKQGADESEIVIGPVANDSTIEVINDYMNGRYSKDIAIQLLLPQKLRDQYVFHTNEALEQLKFQGYEVL